MDYFDAKACGMRAWLNAIEDAFDNINDARVASDSMGIPENEKRI